MFATLADDDGNGEGGDDDDDGDYLGLVTPLRALSKPCKKQRHR